jgi:hypothetical protein
MENGLENSLWTLLILSYAILSRLYQVTIEARVIIEEWYTRNTGCMEAIRFCGKESGFVGRNQVLLEGIRFCQLYCESGVMMA